MAKQMQFALAQPARDMVNVVFVDPEYRIMAHVPRLKHGKARKLGSFLAVFRDWDAISPFEVPYTVSASELPSEIPARVLFKIRRTETTKEA